jgi:hypothetical protein
MHAGLLTPSQIPLLFALPFFLLPDSVAHRLILTLLIDVQALTQAVLSTRYPDNTFFRLTSLAKLRSLRGDDRRVKLEGPKVRPNPLNSNNTNCLRSQNRASVPLPNTRL